MQIAKPHKSLTCFIYYFLLLMIIIGINMFQYTDAFLTCNLSGKVPVDELNDKGINNEFIN
ncbi:hypothetical protein BFX16_02410 [Vibrio cholerae]|nr:predicted protein [Vibrio cholerae RC385]OFI72320.1 hypothetical protein BFX16_02410 [Vibrio cholerae]OFI73443.1 hypothetical protein BFX15_02410 [Vibrio cholerae]RNE82642.1 hypothetical protein EEJ35_08625 [Vibrio cholerae]